MKALNMVSAEDQFNNCHLCGSTPPPPLPHSRGENQLRPGGGEWNPSGGGEWNPPQEVSAEQPPHALEDVQDGVEREGQPDLLLQVNSARSFLSMIHIS